MGQDESTLIDASCRQGGQTSSAGRRLPSVAAGLSLLLAAGSGLAAGPWPAVRNVYPQRTLDPVREQQPIHYPHRASGPTSTPDPADRLLREFLDLHTSMRYEQAAEVARRALEIAPNHPQAHYNLACALARMWRGDEAIQSLERAVDCGWRDLVHLLVDPDLEVLRARPRYQALVRQLRRLVAEEADAGLPAATEAPPGSFDELTREALGVLRETGARAASIALIEDGRCVWRGNVGLADREAAMKRHSFAQVPRLMAHVEEWPPTRLGIGETHRLEKLVAALSAPTSEGLDPEAIWRMPALDPEIGLETSGDATGSPGWMQRVDRSHLGAVLLRWWPGQGRGVVVVVEGGQAAAAARGLADLGAM